MKPESEKLIIADKQLDADGNPKAFVLRNRGEQITLEPGKAWQQLDTYKWVTRGLIEDPRGFHVLANGSVQIHGEQIELEDPNALATLEQRINQHFEAIAPKHSPPAMAHPPAEQVIGPNKVKFKVRLDKMGHLMVAYSRAGERTETGVRGLEGLVRNGLMLKPKSIHLDPLLRYVEIDDIRFDSDAAGAEALESRLNSLYAPVLEGDGEAAIEIRANPAAASGFDIHFFTFRAGARFEVKGHLGQDQLDILQDPVKCQLLRPGTILRLSPPHLIIRRRRTDGGEERIPELPDVHYMHVTAAELQRILNHPSIRRGTAAKEPGTSISANQGPPEIIGFRIFRNPQSKVFLGMEMVTVHGNNTTSHTNAFTHHNVAELQHAGIFRSNLDVVLSLDNRTLSILKSETHKDERIVVDPSSPDSDLHQAGQMLTTALKPRVRPAVELAPAPVEKNDSVTPVVEKSETPRETATIVAEAASVIDPISSSQAHPHLEKPADQEVQPVTVPTPEGNAEIRALFCESDAVRINIEIFRRLESCLGLASQNVQLSLDRVFQDRQFEILSFTNPEISDVLELRSADFVGFYLSYVNERKVLLDYAYRGKRIEWGPQKCLLQVSVTADPEQFSGSALLGMALPESNHFVFVVTPAFKQWIKPREKLYHETRASFATVDDLAAAPENYPLVWPLP